MKSQALLSSAVVLILLAFPALALEPSVSVSVASEKDAVYPGDCNKYIATVGNLDGNHRVDLSVDGEMLSWISLTSAYIDFGSREPQKIIFYLCPTIGTNAGTYNFIFRTKSRERGDTQEIQVPVYVLERPYVEVRDVLFSKDVFKLGETVDATINVKNLGVADAKNIRLLLEIEGANAPEKIRVEIPLIEANRGKSISQKIEFDRYLSHGEYIITAKVVDDIGDILAKKSANIRIEERSELTQDITVKNRILSKSVTITGTNTGNKRDTLELKDYGTAFLVLYSFEQQPAKIDSSGARKTFTWTCTLEPAEYCIVKYEVDYWLLALAIIVTSGAAYVLYNMSQQPGIKKHIVKKDKEHAVHIHVKNRSRNELHNIQVVDHVPEIVSVVAGSISPAIKPSIKSKRGGVELVWTFSKLAPGEERVISYRIRPIVMVMGRIHLPKAQVLAVDAGGKKYHSKSPVVVE